MCAQGGGGGGEADPAEAAPSASKGAPEGPAPKPGQLREAAEEGNLGEVTRLADRGADVEDADEDGWTELI